MFTVWVEKIGELVKIFIGFSSRRICGKLTKIEVRRRRMLKLEDLVKVICTNFWQFPRGNPR